MGGATVPTKAGNTFWPTPPLMAAESELWGQAASWLLPAKMPWPGSLAWDIRRWPFHEP